MSKLKKGIGIDVLTASKNRIEYVFDRFEKVYLSFSAGKDSTALLHLTADYARRNNRRFGVLLVDLEAQYHHTIQHALECVDMYSDVIDLYWVSLPLSLRNAVSQFDPKWVCFDPEKKDEWVRNPPPQAITDTSYFPFFKFGMEFEDFVEEFGHWYSDGAPTACLVGIRSDESLNRFRTMIMDKQSYEGLRWTTWMGKTVYNAYPIYDWRTSDIWTYSAKSGLPQNPIYNLMTKAGVPLGLQRICQPYGDDQRRGLWLFHLLEPETWTSVVRRVSGANSGALYAKENGNILGNGKITKPDHHTWESYSKLLLSTMPPRTKEHFENKIAVFLKWYESRGYPDGIPDDGEVNQKQTPNWKRVCKALLRNDYWCKGLGFSQHTSNKYEKYLETMRKRREKWKNI